MMKRITLFFIIIGALSWVALNAGSPQSSVLKTGVLDEASGLASSKRNPGLLYSHNDSGGKPCIYAIDNKGNLKCTLTLAGIQNRDWEDIACTVDAKSKISYVYVGEIGDNNAKYNSVAVYRFPEPDLEAADSVMTIDRVEKIEIRYEDGPRDAEALFVNPCNGDIYIISKREEKVGLYRVAQPVSLSEGNIAHRLTSLPLGWVTAADLSPNGKKLLVKTYPGVWQFKCHTDKQGALVPGKNPKARPYVLEPQGEGLCWDRKAKGYFTLSESGEGVQQTLYYYK